MFHCQMGLKSRVCLFFRDLIYVLNINIIYMNTRVDSKLEIAAASNESKSTIPPVPPPLPPPPPMPQDLLSMILFTY